MRALVYDGESSTLRLENRSIPVPTRDEALIRVKACGVCRTDLHLVDHELPQAAPPVVPGHQVVGEVCAVGAEVKILTVGDRVGVAWMASVCGACAPCLRGEDNLCERAAFTGCTRDGGYADYLVAREQACYRIPATYDDAHAAPLLCAGLIGYRALRLAGEAERVGIYGFGSAGHLVAQVAGHQGRRVAALTRPGDRAAQEFARALGVAWAGDSTSAPPFALDAALVFAPVGALVIEALTRVRPGGVVVCGGIHMSDIPSFPYALLWGERSVRSVANLSRADGDEFFALAARHTLRAETSVYGLDQAQRALEELRSGRIVGSAVLLTSE